MPRPRTGSTFLRHGARVVRITTDRPDAPKPRWVKECPPNDDGTQMKETDARLLAFDLQRAYDGGRWDPWAESKPEPAPESPPSPPAPLTVYAHAKAWAKGLTYDTADEDRATLERYLAASKLGATPIDAVRPLHAIEFIRDLVARPSAMGGTLSARTVRGCVDVVRRAIDAAIVAEHCAANPFALDGVRKELPALADKSPEARAGWAFSWDEVRALVYSPKVPADRRVWNALAFATGARPQSAAVLRWRDWDRTALPLTRLSIVRGRKRNDGREGSTKTGALMPCPVVPPLAAILAAWWERGWQEHYGRAPTLDDLIVPTKDLAVRKQGRVNRYFKADCKRLELRVRFSYAARHAFATNVVDDGGDPTIVEQITHAPPRKAVSGYRRPPWGRLCAEMAKLRFPTATQDTPPASGEVSLRESLRTAEPSINPECSSVGATGFEGATRVSQRHESSQGVSGDGAPADGAEHPATPGRRFAPGLAPGGALLWRATLTAWEAGDLACLSLAGEAPDA